MFLSDFDGEGVDPDPITSLDDIILTTPRGWNAMEGAIRDAVASAFVTQSFITVTEWAIKNRKFPATGQPHPGDYRPETNPISVFPQDIICHSKVRDFCYLASAQGGKSTSITNQIGWMIDTRPGPAALFYPNEDLVNRKQKEEFAPLFTGTKCLADKVITEDGASKAKWEKSTLMRWTFPNGYLNAMSAASKGSTKSSPYEYIWGDEYGSMEDTSSGDPAMEARARQGRYASTAKFCVLSTAVETDAVCKTTKFYKKTNMRKPYVQCPKCGHDHIMQLKNVRIPKNTLGEFVPEETFYECPDCAFGMNDAVRLQMLLGTMDPSNWRDHAVWTCCGKKWDPLKLRNWNTTGGYFERGISSCPECKKPAPERKTGFWWSAIYSNMALSELAQLYVDAMKEGPSALMQFFNQWMAQTFERPDAGKRFTAKDLASQALDYEKEWMTEGLEVPPDGLVVLAATDVNHYGLDVGFRVFGVGNRSWGVHYERIHGNPRDKRVWERWEELRMRKWKGTDDRWYRAQLMLVDVGDGTTLEWVLPHVNPAKGIIPIRGVPETGVPVWTNAYVPPKSHKNEWWPIGKNPALAVLMGRLLMKADDHGDGRMYFPAEQIDKKTGAILGGKGYDDKYMAQLSNLRFEVRRDGKGGFKDVIAPEVVSMRQEAPDIESYLEGARRAFLELRRLPSLAALKGPVLTSPPSDAPPAAPPDPETIASVAVSGVDRKLVKPKPATRTKPKLPRAVTHQPRDPRSRRDRF